MQEAAAQYGGFQPKAANTVYHDTYYAIGTYAATLVEGFDCPYGSTMLNTSYPQGRGSSVHPQALCIYEADAGSGRSSSHQRLQHLWLHPPRQRQGLWLCTSATILTAGNYDEFPHPSRGTIVNPTTGVQATCSTMLSTSMDPSRLRSAPRATSRALTTRTRPILVLVFIRAPRAFHDHILTFKADFDLLGQKNSLEVTDSRVVNQSQPWFPEFGTLEQMELQTSTMKTEQQFAANAAMYCVVSDQENAWGVKRGYRIIPGKSNIHLSIGNSPFTKKSSGVPSKSHLAVTKVHTRSPTPTSWQNVNMPAAPQQDFSKFFDGEGIENEDLTLWFNLGMHHFTRSEDVPVTLYPRRSDITFAPQNFDRAQEGDPRTVAGSSPTPPRASSSTTTTAFPPPRARSSSRSPSTRSFLGLHFRSLTSALLIVLA